MSRPLTGRAQQGALGSLPPLRDLPLVSVVIPALDEADHIGACLRSLEAQGYPGHALEVLVADGGSTDRTRDIVRLHAATTRLRALRVVENPGRTTAHGLNAGIAAASGDVIAILGAHAAVDSEFVAASVRALQRTGAAATGGPIRATGEGRLAEAIAAALSHPFGVGDARFRYAATAGEVDTVAFAAYRRECFELLGGFDPGRNRGEDDHFNHRIRRAGGRLWLDPAIGSTYYSRSGLRGLAGQYFGYGQARGRAFVIEPASLRPRHLVPAAALLAGSLLVLAAMASQPGRMFLVVAGLVYATASVWSAWRTTRRRGRPSLAPLTALIFPVLHTTYGAGSLAGAVQAAMRRLRPSRAP